MQREKISTVWGYSQQCVVIFISENDVQYCGGCSVL